MPARFPHLPVVPAGNSTWSRNKWATVRLGELLRLERRPVKVEPDKLYQEIGIYCFGRGIFHKAPRTGFEVGEKDLFLMKEGDFILQVTFAWEGAIAIVSAAEDGMYGSTRYPTFRVDEKQCVAKFLLNYFKTEQGLQQLVKICPGSAGRNRVLNIKRLSEVIVPLPALPEQQRVVARIKELAAQIHEARTLRQQAAEEAAALFPAVAGGRFSELMTKSAAQIGDVISFRNDLIRPTDGRTGPIRFIGLQHIESHTGKKIGEDRVLAEELTGRKFKFSPGEIVYGYLRPYLNKVWVADCEGHCSVDQYVIRTNPQKVDTKFIACFMRSPEFLNRAIELTHNLMLPRLRTGLLNSIPMPLPGISEQRQIVSELDALQAEVDALRRLQAETASELDALLPAILDKAFKGEL